MNQRQTEWIEDLEMSVMDLFSAGIALYSLAFCLSSKNSPISEFSPNALNNCYQTLKDYLLQHAQEATEVAGFFLREHQPV